MTPANDNVKPAVSVPNVEYRLRIEERDRWSGPDEFYMFFPTLQEAKAYKVKKIKDEEEEYEQTRGVAPEYYTRVREIKEVVRKDGQVFVGKEVG